jgi:integrase
MAKQNGRGEIEERGENHFVVRVFLGRDGNGKKIRKAKTVHGSYKDAKKALTALLSQVDNNSLATTNITVNAFLDQWLETVKPNLRKKTGSDYGKCLKLYIREPLGAKKLSKLTTMDVQGVYSTMLGKGLSKATLTYTHVVFKKAIRQAVRWKMISYNPCEDVEVPKMTHVPKFYAMNEAEIAKFRGVAKLSKWYTFFELLLGTGLRPSEALGLTWRDVDLVKGIIKVTQQLTRHKKDEWEFEEPKTLRSKRNISLPVTITHMLVAYKQAQEALGLPNPHNLVFHGVDGEPSNENTISQHTFKPLIVKAKLPNEIRMYDLRHTHATLLLLGGVHPKVVQERLGHSSIKITLDTYSHVLPNMQAEAADKLESLVYGDAVPFAPKAPSVPN